MTRRQSPALKAVVSDTRETGINIHHRKENGFEREIAVLDPRNGKAIVTARFYRPGDTCYCCVWVHGDTDIRAASGKAGGGGYHKASVALAYAFGAADIQLSEGIGGRGDGIMSDACEAVARAVTRRRKFIIHVSHA